MWLTAAARETPGLHGQNTSEILVIYLKRRSRTYTTEEWKTAHLFPDAREYD